MKPLVLTGYPIPKFNEEDLGDLAVNFFFRFVWGQLPSPDEVAAYLGPRTPDHGLTEFGKAVLAGRDDFSRHNPIHRWWGGTEMTNDRLWRWDPAKQALVEP
jgi:hypothetical protein